MNEALLEIHENKSKKDPIYCLLFNPSYIEEGETLAFADRLMELCMEYTTKRYGDLLLCNNIVARIYKLLEQTISNDYNVKIFAILFILQWESELAEQVCLLYKDTEDFYNGNYFKRVMLRVYTYIEQTLNFPYNKHNIITTVNNFVLAVQKDYMMGPK